MKKIAVIALSALLMVTAICGCHWNRASDRSADYYHEINQLLKDKEFFKAEVCATGIVLYDQNGTVVENISYDGYQKDDPLVYIRKKDSYTYFVQSTAIDDEIGIMFVNDSSDDMMNGINRIERLGGNAYSYATTK